MYILDAEAAGPSSGPTLRHPRTFITFESGVTGHKMDDVGSLQHLAQFITPELAGANSSWAASIVQVCDNSAVFALHCMSGIVPALAPVTCGPDAPVQYFQVKKLFAN